MKRVKRLLGLAFLLAAIISCLMIHASADETTVASGSCGKYVSWKVINNGSEQILRISGVGDMNDYEYDYDWDLADTTAPWRRYSFTRVEISDSVTQIGAYAFYEMTSIKDVDFSNGLLSVGAYAFYGCDGLTTFKLPTGVTTIGKSAFEDCDGFTSVKLLASVTTIGEKAFYDCDLLESVTIPASVTSIAQNTFDGCYKLTDIAVDSRNPSYAALDGVLFDKNMTNLIFYSRGNTRTAYTIPSGVETIGASAFYNCDALEDIIITDSVTTIEEKAFYDCDGLLSVEIPDSVLTIGEKAFYSCDNVAAVEIGDGVTEIASYAFWYCNRMTSAVIGRSVETIGSHAFNPCSSLTEVYFKGNAPSVKKGTSGSASFDSGLVTLYYIPTMEGWENIGLWQDYIVEPWDGPEEDFGPTIVEGTLAAIEVSMDSELLLWLKFTLPEELLNDEAAYAVVTADRKSGVQTTTIPMTEIVAAGTDSKGRYIIEQGMAAPEMGRSVTVSFVDGSGNYVNLIDYVDGSVAASVSRTVVDYSKLALEKGTTKQKNLNRALLAYGGYAQAYFGVDAGAPVYDVLPDFGFEVPDFADVTANTLTQEMTTSGASLVTPTTQQAFLDSAIYHRVYFTLNKGISIDDLSFVVTKRNTSGEYTEEATPVYESAKKRYYVQIDGIASPLLDYMYTLKITDGVGYGVQNIRTSVVCYLKKGIAGSTNAAQINMFKAMYNYNQVANEFFGF